MGKLGEILSEDEEDSNAGGFRLENKLVLPYRTQAKGECLRLHNVSFVCVCVCFGSCLVSSLHLVYLSLSILSLTHFTPPFSLLPSVPPKLYHPSPVQLPPPPRTIHHTPYTSRLRPTKPRIPNPPIPTKNRSHRLLSRMVRPPFLRTRQNNHHRTKTPHRTRSRLLRAMDVSHKTLR